MSFPRAEIIDIFTDLSDGMTVLWNNEPVPMARFYGVLTKSADVSVGGDDELIRELDEEKYVNKETFVQRRKATLNLTVRDNSGQLFPDDIIETVRQRLYRQSIIDRFTCLNVSVLQVMAIGDVGTHEPVQVRAAQMRVDSRALRQATMDIIIHYVTTEVDESADGSWIETINGGDAIAGEFEP